MSSNAITTWLRGSPTWILAAVLAGFLPVNVMAEPALAQSAASAQGAAPAVGVTGASSILKTPTGGAVQPIPYSTGIQPPSGTASQLVPANLVAPIPARAAAGAIPPVAGLNPGATSAPAVQPQGDGLELLSPAQRRTYERAAAAFTDFCHEWEGLLHEREVDNLAHLSWREDGGLQTANYTGYGKVESCICKESKEGLPIGKIQYEEINYSMVGKTIDEARHAEPKLIHEIRTLEIFSWDKGKWFY
jgi:hypothetical protein